RHLDLLARRFDSAWHHFPYPGNPGPKMATAAERGCHSLSDLFLDVGSELSPAAAGCQTAGGFGANQAGGDAVVRQGGCGAAQSFIPGKGEPNLRRDSNARRSRTPG